MHKMSTTRSGKRVRRLWIVVCALVVLGANTPTMGQNSRSRQDDQRRKPGQQSGDQQRKQTPRQGEQRQDEQQTERRHKDQQHDQEQRQSAQQRNNEQQAAQQRQKQQEQKIDQRQRQHEQKAELRQKQVVLQQQRSEKFSHRFEQQQRLSEQRQHYLEQQKRQAQFRYHQAYWQHVRDQEQHLHDFYDYRHDPFFDAAPCYRYYRSRRFYEVNQYVADVLRQAVRYGFEQGLLAGRADREDGWRFSYEDCFAYEDAAYGYGGYYVDLEEYRYYFREGFQRGYEDGYYDRYRYGRFEDGQYLLHPVVFSKILFLEPLH